VGSGGGGGLIVQAGSNGHKSVHWAHDLLAPSVPPANENYAIPNSRTLSPHRVEWHARFAAADYGGFMRLSTSRQHILSILIWL
jgi:hypothetical protein